MWNPISIEIHNLFAHKNSTYEFKNNTCTVIFGDNKDDKGLQNNGAGKTTLFEAVCIALTNERRRVSSIVKRMIARLSFVLKILL